MMRRLIFNGKFYAGCLNGVHRVADRLIREIDRLIEAMPPVDRPEATLLLPKQRGWAPELKTIRLVDQPLGHTQRWEQFVLPGKAKGAVLINLCNLAPIFHPRKILLMHDAQFLFKDSSYPVRQRWGHRLLAPAIARSSARVLTVSQYSRQVLDLTGVSARERTDVLYNGIDHILDAAAEPGFCEQLGLVPRGYVLLFGSPKRYKNVEIIFDAFRSSALAHLRLVVVGAGEAVHRGAGMRPPPDTLFVGSIDDARLRALYESAACLVFPSRTEGFGLPPLEAMSLSCPAIVAPAGALPEICRDAVCYADVDAAGEWIDAILAISTDADMRAGKIAAGRERAAAFTWARAGADLLQRAVALASA